MTASERHKAALRSTAEAATRAALASAAKAARLWSSAGETELARLSGEVVKDLAALLPLTSQDDSRTGHFVKNAQKAEASAKTDKPA